MFNKDLMIILRSNIYNCLIDHNVMKKLAEETFKNVLARNSKAYIFEGGFDNEFKDAKIISINEVRELVQRFTMLINRKNIFTEQEIDTIYKECLVKDEENLNQDDFTVFFQIFLELLYELTTPKNINED